MDILNNTLSVLRTHPYASASISLFLVSGLAALVLPTSVAGLFENSVFKILILVAVLVLLMSALSRYRVSAMANEISTTEPSGSDGQPPTGPQDVTEWSSKDGTNRLRLRGYDYVDQDVTNHLPGGHGDMELNANQGPSDPLVPDGYDGPSYSIVSDQL